MIDGDDPFVSTETTAWPDHATPIFTTPPSLHEFEIQSVGYSGQVLMDGKVLKGVKRVKVVVHADKPTEIFPRMYSAKVKMKTSVAPECCHVELVDNGS